MKKLGIILLPLLLMISCKPDEPVGPVEPEIDTIIVRDTVLLPDTVLVSDTVLVPDTAAKYGVLHCVQPPFLKPGDKVALISPSYYVPMTTIQNAANVVRSGGL